MVNYYLMHKDTQCGILKYDEAADRIISYHDFGNKMGPFLGNADDLKVKKWWGMRAIPASRSALKSILAESGCLTAGHYLAKNLAFSMTDTYWICPEGASLHYEDINRFAKIYGEKMPYHNETSYNPNASLGGQMDKYWDLNGEVPILVKESYRNHGQQAANEAFATLVHTRQNSNVPFVYYHVVVTKDGNMCCTCPAFTSDRVEFVSAYEVVESQKTRNDISLYDHYIETCVRSGIDREQIQGFMDYQTLTDFIISNTDEHLQNFGILRDADSMHLLGPAPIYDSGNSMFYAEDRKTPYSRAEMLERRITGFYPKEEQVLKKIQNKQIVRLDLLPSPAEVKEFFAAFGIPEWKTDVISKNYATKLQLTKEFQHGKSISLYHEKQAERADKKGNEGRETRKEEIMAYEIPRKGEQAFIMLCGLPGTGKTKKMEEVLSEYAKNGGKVTDASESLSIEEALTQSKYRLNEETMLNQTHPLSGISDTLAGISLNAIREEIKEASMPWDELAFVVAKARIKAALLGGASVIYDASNLKTETRQQFIELAESVGVQKRELIVMDHPGKTGLGVDNSTLQNMTELFKNNKPCADEGWTNIFMEKGPELDELEQDIGLDHEDR